MQTQTQRSKVFICNKGGYDYGKACSFGDIVYITSGQLNIDDLNSMYRKSKKALKDSSPEDFILITGLSSFTIILSCLFSAKFGKVNWLMQSHGEYKAVTLVFPTGDRSE